MISTKLFSAFLGYFKRVFGGMTSLLATSFSAIPYLFSLGEFRKEVTEQYPDPVSSRNQDDLPPRTRGLLENDINKCTGCGDCQRICPVQCITIESESGPDSGKVWVSVFDVDFGKCMFCGLCVDVCEPRSLTHTKYFELSAYKVGDLVRPMGWGPVSTELKEKWRQMRNVEGVD